jgi:heavy metal sensor kinase
MTEMAMRSIRLSLVMYFLVLLTLALGAVCWLVYQTATAALSERLAGSEQLVKQQYTAQCERLVRGLDHRLAREAQRVAAMVRPPLHVEGLYPFGVLGAPFTFQPHLHLPLWLAEGVPGPRKTDGSHRDQLAEQLWRERQTQIDIEAAEDLIPTSKQPDFAHEFFQIYSSDGRLLKRSQSLGAHVMKLPAMNDADTPYDIVTLDASGPKVRRITLRTAITRYRFGGFPPGIWRRGPVKMALPPGKGPGSPPGPPRPFVVEGETPTIFVQYAIDLGPSDAQVAQYAEDRDWQLAQLHADATMQLQSLQRRLLGIALATFAATLAGGYFLLRLGLAPIERLSDAVSEVSERDFRLKVEPSRLPAELQPIAGRLSHTLEQLGRAFDREKQAAADISHELRTPLAALLTTIEVALRKSRSIQEYREILEECRGSGEQMSHMVERLLALARLDAGAERVRPRAIDAGELALQCADIIRPLARAQGLTITAHVVPPLPAQADPDKLREVITNLLHNAVEYNRPGGTIDLTVERAAGALTIEVRDTGIGISAEARAHIFERFYRADPSRHADTPHAGLGLAIVKSYVDLLGGTIAVDSQPGVGTTFRVQVPVREPTVEPTLVVA